MKHCRLSIYAYWARCLIMATNAMVSILYFAGDARADEVQGKLKRDLTVGANHDVHLKAGQVVQVMSKSGSSALIIVKLQDSSKGAFQIDSSALEMMAPSAGQRAAAKPPAPNPISPGPANPAPAPVAADPSLPEDKVTLVQVSWPHDSKLPAPYSGEDEAKAGSYSYKLYLPPGYYEHPQFHYPTLFIMAPGGSAELGDLKDRVRDEGWIVVLLMEAKNGPWGPIYGNALATCTDVTAKGLRIQKGLMFATGFSGGARGTSMLTQIYPGFYGELLQGAAFAQGDAGEYLVKGIPRDHPYAVFMAVGSTDGNKSEVAKIRDQLRGIPFKAVTFEGGHQPTPLAQKNQGLDWLILQTFTGNMISEDLRECGIRQFRFLAKRWADETDNALKTEAAHALAALGERLNLPVGSNEALQLKKIKDASPLTP